MDAKEIIYRVGYIRNRANLSARALSVKLGKSEAYINRMEQEGFYPSLQVLLEIIEACESTAEEFFYRDITKYQTDKEAIKFLASLNEKQKTAIRNLYE